MAAIDDVINSLSSDELDLLNSDPKMLNDFKSKYIQSNPMMDTAKAGLSAALPSPSFNQPIAPTSDNPAIGALQAAGQTLRDPTRIASTVGQPGEEVGNAIEKFGQDINAPITGKLGGFLTKTALNPLTWIGMNESLLPKGIKAEVPNLLQKAANIPERATILKGFNEPTPTVEDIESGVKNVQNMVSKVWKEHGDLLNKARSNAGIPANEDEVADSIRKYGNEFNLDLNKPLNMPENFKMKAPDMQEAPIKPFEKGDIVIATHPTQPPVKLKYTMPGMMVGTNDPAFDLQTPVPAPGKPWSHPIDSTLSKSTLESYGYKVPEGVEQMKAEPSNAMPYTIGEHDTPQQLVTEINRFKQNIPYIDKKDQAKAAAYLQDQIVKQGVFKQDTAVGRTAGVLKSQYRTLADIISNSSEDLQTAKSRMGDLYDTMEDISKKLQAGSGQAHAYLKRLFTSKSPAVQDDLKALTKLDQLGGTNTVETLFKKFAGEAYGQTFGQGIHTIFQAPYAAITSPKLVMTPLMKYGPAAIKAGKFGGIGATEQGLQSLRDNPELQSVRDRMNNQSSRVKFSESKYANK